MDFIREKFYYVKSGGYEIPLLLSVPECVENPPLVIFCHGFGGNKSEKCRHFYRLASKLSAVGFATARFDFAGFGDSLAPSCAFTLSQAKLDVESVLSFYKSNVCEDLNQVGLIGYSFGGLVCAKAIGEGFPADYACLISAVEHYVIPKSYSKTVQIKDSLNLWIKGYEVSQTLINEYMAFRGSKALSKSKIPVQLIHGSNDDSVSLAHLIEYQTVVDTDKFPPVVIDGANHYFSEKPHQDQLDESVLSFLNKARSGNTANALK